MFSWIRVVNYLMNTCILLLNVIISKFEVEISAFPFAMNKKFVMLFMNQSMKLQIVFLNIQNFNIQTTE